MGNSTRSLQSVVDFAASIGEVRAILEAAGYADEPACSIASDVMRDMLARKFNWKFNRRIFSPFYSISWQQDYPQVGVTNMGWIEHAYMLDINNTQLPKPIYWLKAVRDMERTSRVDGTPSLVCWLPNDQLDQVAQNAWPGAGVKYTNPLGAATTPANPFTCFVDANGNILVLTTYGTTGGVAPAAAANANEGVTVNDGTCVWTVAAAKSQGFRIASLPSQTGVVYQINVIGQMKPPTFANLQQLLDPLPDDYAGYFRTGFVAHLYNHSPIPSVKAKFAEKHNLWMTEMKQATGQGDREPDSYSIVPERSIMSGGGADTVDYGPAWPWGPSVGR